MIDLNNPDYTNTPASAKRSYKRFDPVTPGSLPVVTILTAFYNTDAVFEETVESVRRQTFQQWEWLIVNDCSDSPDAIELLEKFRTCGDPRIKVLDMPRNGGPSKARNYGVSKASTEYIYHLDSDDLIEPTTLEKCFWYLFSHPECPWVNGWSVGFGAEEYLWRFGYGDGDRFLSENLVTGRTMIRKDVFEAVGGYDPDIRGGAEDWGFWLKAAENGYWGATIPEVFDWYRRREDHWSRWETIDDRTRLSGLREEFASTYPRIFNGEFPRFEPRPHLAMDGFEDRLPAENRLSRGGKHLVMILPWMAMGGSDKFNLDLMDQLLSRGWSISVVTTKRNDNSWRAEFEKRTPEVFVLADFVHPTHYAIFMRYLLHSRSPDALFVSCSELGYWLLPYLKYHFPAIPFLDYSHIEEDYWKNGGHPRYGAKSQLFLERNLVTSDHLKNWMVQKCDAVAEKIDVLTINVDPDLWKPDNEVRKKLRSTHVISDDVPILFFAGRFCRQKQPEVLLKTFLSLKTKGLNFKAVLAGDGEDRGWVEDFVKRNNLGDCVKLVGALPSDSVREWMQAADLFFLPSLWEGIALSIYEAMSVGLAVVGADVGGQRELVADDCGILVDRKNLSHEEEVAAYARILTDLLGNPDRIFEMGRNSRARIIEHYPLNAMGDRFVKVVETCRMELCSSERTVIRDEGFVHELAVRALDYHRLDDLAERLWHERMRLHAKPVEKREVSYTVDPLREWQHIHKYVPFKLYRFWKQNLNRRQCGCYDLKLSVGDRLDLLKKTGFYRGVMHLKNYPILKSLLPNS